MEQEHFNEIIEKNNERIKFFLMELDRLERKIDRQNKDFWKYISDLQSALTRAKLEPNP